MKKRSDRFNAFNMNEDNLPQQFDEAALYGESRNNTKELTIIKGRIFPANHLAEAFDAAMWHGSTPPVDSVNKKHKTVKTEDDKSKSVTSIQSTPLTTLNSNQTSASPSLDSSSEALCSTSLSTSTNKESSIVVFRTPITEPKIKFENVINTSQTATYTHL